jgi:hypothetical protein
MNTNTMTRILGAGKWLVALALAGCGGSAGGDAVTSGGAGGSSGSSIMLQSRAGTGGESGAPALPGDAGQPSAGATQSQVAGAGGIDAAAGAPSGANGGQPAAGNGGAGNAGMGGAAPPGGSGGAVASAGAANGGDTGSGGIAAGGSSGSLGSSGQGGTTGGTGSSGAAGTGGSGGAAVCECSTGQCCDGCHVRAMSYFLGQFVRYSSCTDNVTPDLDYWSMFCDGTATGSRWGLHTKYTTDRCDRRFVGGICVQEQPSDIATCEQPQ